MDIGCSPPNKETGLTLTRMPSHSSSPFTSCFLEPIQVTREASARFRRDPTSGNWFAEGSAPIEEEAGHEDSLTYAVHDVRRNEILEATQLDESGLSA